MIDDFGYGEIDEPYWLYSAEVRFTGFAIDATEETAPGVIDEGLLTTVSGSLTLQMAEVGPRSGGARPARRARRRAAAGR